MRVAIMQPTYLPWSGYFALLSQVDVFVFLDDVPYAHQGWQQRNRIKGSAGPLWLTVPVRRSGRAGQLIKDVEIDARPWATAHQRTIQQSYARAPFVNDALGALAEVYAANHARLCDLNCALIDVLAQQLGVRTPRVRSSTLRSRAGRIERLVDICRELGATEYLSPVGSFDYLDEQPGAFEAAGVALRYHSYRHPGYAQLHGAFVPFLSVVDLLCNERDRAADIIQSAIHPSMTHEECRALASTKGGEVD